MYLFDLQTKLKKLHRDLYVHVDEVNNMHCGLVSSGIYIKNSTRAQDNTGSGKNYANAQTRKHLEDLESGQRAKFVMGVCLNYVPEYDIYDLTRDKILMPGWRTIATRLVKLDIVTLDKAKKVFKCRSLGETDWDKARLYQRIRWVKGDRDA